MPVRFTVTLSSRMSQELELLVGPSDELKCEAMQKAVMLYLVSRRAQMAGYKVGVARDDCERPLMTEFVNV